MSEQTPNPNITENNEPLFPPHYLLILAGVGFLVTVIVYLTQPTFSVIGYGGLALTVLALIGWAVLAPDQLKAILTGRTARFGGTSVLVTIVFLVALIAIYVVVRGRVWRLDLTETNQFSLTDASREAIRGIGADPTTPPIKLLAFYGAGQAGRRDQDTVLFDDYQTTSNGKITYEFIDPVREPLQAETYEVTRPGVIVVVALDEAGEPDVDNAETVNSVLQDEMTNAILRVAASGEFRAFFLQVDEGVPLSQMSVVNSFLTDQFDWTTQEVSMFDFTGPQAELTLDDPAVDGQVLIIPGGTTALNDDELQFVTDYVDNGGDLVVLAAASIGEENTSLATAENLSNYLFENFGVRFNNDVVVDLTQSVQDQPWSPIATDLPGQDIMGMLTGGFPPGSLMVFELPHSLDISPTLPTDVTVTTLANSGENSYAKEDVNVLLEDNGYVQADTDRVGPFALAAAAENATTGARVVLYGSPSVFLDDWMAQRVVNTFAGASSLVWATQFDEFAQQVTVDPTQNEQDAPVFADQQQIRNINFITVILLPFGILAIGVLVWWFNRERGPAPVTRERGEASAAGD